MTRPSQSLGRRPPSIVIARVRPEVDGGRWPAKRELGDLLRVEATLFKEGHDKLAAVVQYRAAGARSWREAPMVPVNPGLDLWRAEIPLDRLGRWEFTIEAWTDHWASWTDEVEKKRAAGQDVTLELAEGRALLAETAKRATGRDKSRLQAVEKTLAGDGAEPAAILLDPALDAAMARHPDRGHADRYGRTVAVTVERVRARFAAWYEMFPRSQGTDPDAQRDLRRSRGAPAGDRRDGVRRGLPAADPPDRPRLPQGAEQHAAPWARRPRQPLRHRRGGGRPRRGPSRISARIDDFRAFREAAEALGMEVALDFAIQCAPDHPWVKQHPEWFQFRPDGTIKYAENPPKKYQDIVNVDFYCKDWEALWEALRDVMLYWAENGVRTFRVDNPHTKPVAVLGMGDRRGEGALSRHGLPVRGVHPPADAAHAGQGRIQPVLHLLHLAQLQGGADRVPGASWSRPATICGPTSSPTRPTSCTPSCRRAAGRPS